MSSAYSFIKLTEYRNGSMANEQFKYHFILLNNQISRFLIESDEAFSVCISVG